MTAGTPKVTSASDWTFELAAERVDATSGESREERLGLWNMAGFRAIGLDDVVCDIHCVTRWSKLDVAWRGVSIDAALAAAGFSAERAQAEGLGYARAECDGGYAANLKLADLLATAAGPQAWIALELSGQPLPEPHGGPARLLVPKLYFWKSAKWVRRLVLSPYDRKGYWEKLGYHNYGDPWREQRYRGISDGDWRKTLDPELSRRIRRERLARRDDDET